MAGGTFLYLSRADVERVNVSMRETIEALEQMFKEKGEGRVEMPPKPGIHPRQDAFIHAMPAYIPSMESAGIKWVSGYPQNKDKALHHRPAYPERPGDGHPHGRDGLHSRIIHHRWSWWHDERVFRFGLFIQDTGHG